MSEKIIEEGIEQLEELLRSVSNTLSPYKDKYAFLQQKQLRDRLYGSHPKCFLALKGMGQPLPFLPICNRMGIIDPNIISFSMKVAKRMASDERMNQKYSPDQFNDMLKALERLLHIYSKDTPKPPIAAARKRKITRMFQNIRQYLKPTPVPPTPDETEGM